MARVAAFPTRPTDSPHWCFRAPYPLRARDRTRTFTSGEAGRAGEGGGGCPDFPPRPTLVIDGSLDEEPAPCPASTTFSQTQDYITQ